MKSPWEFVLHLKSFAFLMLILIYKSLRGIHNLQNHEFMKCYRLKPYQYIFKSCIKNHGGTSLVVQWLKLHTPSTGDPDWIRGQET